MQPKLIVILALLENLMHLIELIRRKAANKGIGE